MSASTPSANLGKRIADVFGHFPEVLAVYLFGSVAEGRAGPHSDLDLAVVPANPAARGRRLDILAALVAAGLDDVDLAILDGADVVLRFEAVRPNPSHVRARGLRTRRLLLARRTRILRPPPHPGDTGRSAETQAPPCLGPRSSAGACLSWKNTWPS